MGTQLSGNIASYANVYVDPGYHKRWTYQHLDALQYVCDTVTVYCLQPRDLWSYAGRSGLKLVKDLLEGSKLRVIAKESHFQQLETLDLSEVSDAKDRREIKALSKELAQRSRYDFYDTVHVSTVRSLPDGFTQLGVDFAVAKVRNAPKLRDYFRGQEERFRDQLPEFLQPDKHPRQVLVSLPDPLSSMEDKELRVYGLPYAFFTDWLAMYQADVHIPLYLHAKWDEWYWKCWEQFALEMPCGELPKKVLKTATPSQSPTRDVGYLMIAAMAELVRMVKVEGRVSPKQFRQLGGFELLRQQLFPILMNSLSSYSSLEDRKALIEDLQGVQKKRVKQLLSDIRDLSEDPKNKAWIVLKGVMIPGQLLLALLNVVGWEVEAAPLLLDGAYFYWRYRNNSKRIKKFREAAKRDGIWFGLLVNQSSLLAYEKLSQVEN